MALRSDRHRSRPIAALALYAGTTIGPRCATIHVGQEADALQVPPQAPTRHRGRLNTCLDGCVATLVAGGW